jgi:D-aminopeptidase
MSSATPRLPAPRIGVLPSGPRDAITDVAGVTVGHVTLADGPIQTGVTVLRPHQGDVFQDKVPAAASIVNGFGKSTGLLQVGELGTLETPVALTNTFSVPAVAAAQIRHAVALHPEIGRGLPTLNPLVFECNDGYLNDIQAMAVTQAHYETAYAAAEADFGQGAVGAGRGMSAFRIKGGIGSASRIARGARICTVGALVLANFGRLETLTVGGRPFGRWLAGGEPKQYLRSSADPGERRHGGGVGNLDDADDGDNGDNGDDFDKGSIIMLLATDAPLDARQLRRLSLRAAAGLARTGSVYGHGSGDIALAFSTAYTVPQRDDRPMPAVAMLHESHLNGLFEAAAEAVEQSIVHALWHADTVTGRRGHVRRSIRELAPAWQQWLRETAPD